MTRAFTLALAGICLLSGMDAVIKLMTQHYPVLEVAFLRFLCGAGVSALACIVLRPGWPSRETITANALRSIVVAITGVTFFYALSALPLAEAVSLSFLSPVFLALFGALLLGERLDARIFLALGAGFLGMLVIVGGRIGGEDYSDRALWGAAAALVSAVSFALAMVLLRARATKDAVVIIVLMHSLGPALILGLPAALVWQPVATADLPWFVLIGAIGFCGHYMLSLAFAAAEAARLAPLEYTALIWTSLLGYAVFGEVPGLATVIGVALIVAGAVVAHRRAPAEAVAGT